MSGIVQQLKKEREHIQNQLQRIDEALAALGSVSSSGSSRTMLAAARRKISVAQKAPWAKQRTPRPKRTISAAGRRRIAAAQRANQRGLLPRHFREESSPARQCVNLGHSIADWSVPLVREPDSSGLSPASEALAGAGGIGWGVGGRSMRYYDSYQQVKAIGNFQFSSIQFCQSRRKSDT